MQARFPQERVRIEGASTEYVRASDDTGESRTVHFCPNCGATVYYRLSGVPEAVAVPVGAFADPAFPPPRISVYESRRHPWVELPAATERDDS